MAHYDMLVIGSGSAGQRLFRPPRLAKRVRKSPWWHTTRRSESLATREIACGQIIGNDSCYPIWVTRSGRIL